MKAERTMGRIMFSCVLFLGLCIIMPYGLHVSTFFLLKKIGYFKVCIPFQNDDKGF